MLLSCQITAEGKIAIRCFDVFHPSDPVESLLCQHRTAIRTLGACALNVLSTDMRQSITSLKASVKASSNSSILNSSPDDLVIPLWSSSSSCKSRSFSESSRCCSRAARHTQIMVATNSTSVFWHPSVKEVTRDVPITA